MVQTRNGAICVAVRSEHHNRITSILTPPPLPPATHHSYLQVSAIAAKCVRACLKPEAAKQAVARGEATLKIRGWEAGKPATPSSTLQPRCWAGVDRGVDGAGWDG